MNMLSCLILQNAGDEIYDTCHDVKSTVTIQNSFHSIEIFNRISILLDVSPQFIYATPMHRNI